jgi:hypothetical protein
VFVLAGPPTQERTVVRGVPALVYDIESATRDLAGPIAEVAGLAGLPPHESPWCRAGRTVYTKERQVPGPGYPCAVCRERAGWLKPVEARAGRFAIAPTAAFASQALKVPVEGGHLLLENRRRLEFDGSLPGEGLLVWRVTAKGCEAALVRERAAIGEVQLGVGEDARGTLYVEIRREY